MSRLRAAVVVAALTATLTGAQAAHGTTLEDPSRARSTGERAADCAAPGGAFTPTSLAIPGVVTSSRVLALGRDRRGVPRTPPLTERGRWQLAWDSASGIRPGGSHGVVRLNAHTYPRSGAYGFALGNRLLARLGTGDRLVVSGAGGRRLCYSVTRRVRVPAERTAPAYYSSTGPSRLAILVCSGTRRGPGDWSHRTIWFAEPLER